jgi:D-alanyl-D-alanine carboxypeptidase
MLEENLTDADLPQERERESTKGEERTAKLLLLAVLGVVLSALGTYGSLSYFSAGEVTQTAAVAAANETASAPNPFDAITLEARAVYVFDVRTGNALFALNSEAQLPLASITKLMTALIVSEHLARDEEVLVGSESIAQEGSSGFIHGELFKMQELLAFTLVGSSNDGAHALARAATEGGTVETFVEAMNERALSLGLLQTYFRNPTGLDSTEQVSGGYGSAFDVALLMAHILERYPAVMEQTRQETLQLASRSGGIYNATNTNSATRTMPGLIASKTGYTDLAGGNLVVAFDSGLNHPIVAVVLGSTEEGRFRDMQKLMDASRKALQIGSFTNTNREVQ